jgi:hypothetical protein
MHAISHTPSRPLQSSSDNLSFLIFIRQKKTRKTHTNSLQASSSFAQPKIPTKMTLNLGSPWLSRLSHPPLPRLAETVANNNSSSSLLPLLLFTSSSSTLANFSKTLKAKASLSESESGVAGNSVVSRLLDEELLGKVSAAKDANEALEMIADKSGTSGGVVGVDDCCLIITAALQRNNAGLALSVFYAMRASFDQGGKYEVYWYSLFYRGIPV